VTDGLPPFEDDLDAPRPPDEAPAARSSSGRGGRAGAHFAPKAGRYKAARRRRWPRRVAIASVVLVLLVAGLAVSGYVYVQMRFNEIKKVTVPTLTKQAPNKPGAPFDILLVGSDSRQFVDSGSQADEFGSGSSVTGQRSDVIIIARVVPATHQILMLSIPRDTWVNIPGNVPYVSGMNRINAAFNSGPTLLVDTIQKDFGIPINHYVEVNFEGFSDIVNALGGIYLDFSTPVYDKMSGLKITKTGCQIVNGAQALSLVRSRDEYYEATDGTYDYDGMGDWSRIRRQDAFFHAVLAKVDTSFTDPLRLNSFISATVHDVTIDDTFTSGSLFGLAEEFHGLSQKALNTEVLPTEPEVLNGSDVLAEAQPYDEQMITKFLAFGAGTGSSSSAGGGPTTTTAPAIAPSTVSVQVLNGNGTSGAAGTAEGQLRGIGFTVSGTGDASSFTYGANEIEYGPSGQQAAQLLQSKLVGGATLVPQSTLTGSSLVLVVGSSYAGVITSGGTASAPTTTVPPASSSNVVFDNPQTLPEPWDPTTCNP
jgi:LCP family protein required for cell wall assembly